jgi:hypothetical protein
LKHSTWQGKEICGMIGTMAVNSSPILDCPQGAGTAAGENTSDEMVMGAVREFCDISVPVCQQNHSDLSLKAPDNALKQFSQKTRIVEDDTMSKSAKAKVDKQLGIESHQLSEQKI